VGDSAGAAAQHSYKNDSMDVHISPLRHPVAAAGLCLPLSRRSARAHYCWLLVGLESCQTAGTFLRVSRRCAFCRLSGACGCVALSRRRLCEERAAGWWLRGRRVEHRSLHMRLSATFTCCGAGRALGFTGGVKTAAARVLLLW